MFAMQKCLLAQLCGAKKWAKSNKGPEIQKKENCLSDNVFSCIIQMLYHAKRIVMISTFQMSRLVIKI